MYVNDSLHNFFPLPLTPVKSSRLETRFPGRPLLLLVIKTSSSSLHHKFWCGSEWYLWKRLISETKYRGPLSLNYREHTVGLKLSETTQKHNLMTSSAKTAINKNKGDAERTSKNRKVSLRYFNNSTWLNASSALAAPPPGDRVCHWSYRNWLCRVSVCERLKWR